MAITELAKWIPCNLAECVLYCARIYGDYKEIKEFDFSGGTDIHRKLIPKQSFKTAIQVIPQN